ncbi:hypothetical protein [Miltoncostaea marina]|uniref:hypothetical protein n=1 Tax=Miltoncostaea marina TaxID=2843215 RepID=UPI001C3E0593|nr:hypothetical protein [Miltoncostaea marina]
MSETETTTAEPPACERCGTRTFPSRRKMKAHGLDIAERKAIPVERVVDTWRCPRCGRETPRD